MHFLGTSPVSMRQQQKFAFSTFCDFSCQSTTIRHLTSFIRIYLCIQ
jgi:hypothetical protein